jgi:hypothetical protein
MAQEVTVKVSDLRELFRERAFDPFGEETDEIGSIAQMAQLPRVLVPAASLTPQTERQVRHALSRYCAHMIGNARRKLSAMRWVGIKTFLVGLVFFAISLAASAAVNRALFIPAGLRTLASESLIVAGWVVIWQPLDTLVQGWWPQWEEERTFRAIDALALRVEGY